ncbi:WD40-repeat-containing domain protein [Obelidium mucronatum]|nr:WD40-repeat-containing domain protein [Obelidium mucronatum]
MDTPLDAKHRYRIAAQRWATLALDANKSVARTSGGTVAALALDRSEQLLLAAGADAKVRVFDLARNAQGCAPQVAVSTSDKSIAHKFSVTAVSWYPHDAGLFTSSSTDKTVKVWDAHTMEPACSFNLKEKVYLHALSPVSSSTALIAGNQLIDRSTAFIFLLLIVSDLISTLGSAAAESSYVRLCDMKSGGYAQMLVGHTRQVSALAWSNQDEYILASGSMDNTIRIWDIRKSKSCLSVLTPPSTVKSSLASSSTTVSSKPTANVTKPKELAKPNHIMGLAFSPTGSHLVSISHDATFQTWCTHTMSLSSNHVIPDTNFHGAETTNFVTPDITRLYLGIVGQELVAIPAVGPGSRCIGLYNIHTGESAGLLKGHFGRTACLKLRQSYQELISGGFDAEILIWSPTYLRESGFGDGDPEYERAMMDTWSDDGGVILE